jgi:acyl carrier protein
MSAPMDDDIRRILDEFANLDTEVASLGDDDDLYAAGLTSHNTINLMLSLEGKFSVEFPESMLRLATFQSVSAIREAVLQLQKEERDA